jgi:DNA-binding NarL/FixJ family response regulator
MMAEPTLVRSVFTAGANGYILKSDLPAIKTLAAILLSVANGGTYFSPSIRVFLPGEGPNPGGPSLTPRQLEAISLCAAYPGSSLAQLAGEMGISESTLGNLLSGAYARLNVRNRAEAILKVQSLGLIGNTLPHQTVGQDISGA